MRELWSRIKDRVARLFGREVAPGRFESGAKFSWRGWLGAAPFVWPRREYLIYIPRGWSRWRRAPLLVLCHGCKQSPEEIAEATRIVALADHERWLVLLPRQNDSANTWRCWNWFDARTAEGAGEAAIVAAQIAAVANRYRADPRRVIVAGMSAGGALAAVIGLKHAGLVRGVVAHSGLACGAAASAMTALGVMMRGPETDVERIAEESRLSASRDALPVPLLAIHGEQDGIVAPRNTVALVRQYLRFNGHAAMSTPLVSATALPDADAESRTAGDDGRIVTTREWKSNGRLIVRFVSVGGLGHAWSGGDGRFPYNDPAPPDAGALIAAFARDAVP